MKRNAPGRRAERALCLHRHGDPRAYASEAFALQVIRSRLPILSLHVGLDTLASFGGARHA